MVFGGFADDGIALKNRHIWTSADYLVSIFMNNHSVDFRVILADFWLTATENYSTIIWRYSSRFGLVFIESICFETIPFLPHIDSKSFGSDVKHWGTYADDVYLTFAVLPSFVVFSVFIVYTIVNDAVSPLSSLNEYLSVYVVASKPDEFISKK